MKKETIYLIAGGLLLAAGSVLLKRNNSADNQISNKDEDMSVNSKLPRGYRNNNPLNIRLNAANKWQGKVASNTDGVFEQFESMAYGYRAAFVLLRNYINNYDCGTLSKLIARWAPANENNTAGYITRVCDTTGFAPDTYINPYSEAQMTSLVYAMSLVENGTKIMPDEQAINKGWQLYIS